MTQKLRKAVFPVAGMGTRFLPVTKANPKEMLLILVTSSSKRAIEDHFDKNYEMEDKLERAGKPELLSIVRDVVQEGVSCVYVRQPEALGLGHAVLCALSVVGNERFAVILADDLIANDGHCCLRQMHDVFNTHQCSILGVQEIAASETDKYGMVKASPLEERLGLLEGIIEKPQPKDAPSNLAVVGRFILTPRIIELQETTARRAGDEIQMPDANARLLLED